MTAPGTIAVPVPVIATSTPVNPQPPARISPNLSVVVAAPIPAGSSSDTLTPPASPPLFSQLEKDKRLREKELKVKEKDVERLAAREKAIANLKKFEFEQEERNRRKVEREDEDMRDFKQKQLELEQVSDIQLLLFSVYLSHRLRKTVRKNSVRTEEE